MCRWDIYISTYLDTYSARYTEDQFRAGMEHTVAEVAASGRHAVFGAACYRHGILMHTEWAEVRLVVVVSSEQLSSVVVQVRVEGVSARDQLLGLVTADTSLQVVTCITSHVPSPACCRSW